ncbi:hypothetical protein D3C77_421190 [compost metagenome]
MGGRALPRLGGRIAAQLDGFIDRRRRRGRDGPLLAAREVVHHRRGQRSPLSRQRQRLRLGAYGEIGRQGLGRVGLDHAGAQVDQTAPVIGRGGHRVGVDMARRMVGAQGVDPGPTPGGAQGAGGVAEIGLVAEQHLDRHGRQGFEHRAGLGDRPLALVDDRHEQGGLEQVGEGLAVARGGAGLHQHVVGQAQAFQHGLGLIEHVGLGVDVHQHPAARGRHRLFQRGRRQVGHGGGGAARAGAQPQRPHLGQGHVGHGAAAVGGAVHRGVVHQHQMAVTGAPHVQLDHGHAQPLAGLDGRQRVLGRVGPAGAVGDDQDRTVRVRDLGAQGRDPVRRGRRGDAERGGRACCGNGGQRQGGGQNGQGGRASDRDGHGRPH